MNYIVLDLEWNQCPDGKRNEVEKLPFEIIEVGEDVPEEADFGLALNGDSMEPRYHDKQAVWVQQTDTLSNGEIGIFYLDGMTYCKQLKQDKDGIFLISLNSKYQPISITAESSFKVFGRVLN